MRWGLIGASDIAATSIIPAIVAQPGGRVVAVHSRSAQRGEAYARQHGIDRSHDSPAALLADPEIDAVYVSTTNDRRTASGSSSTTTSSRCRPQRRRAGRRGRRPGRGATRPRT